MTTHNETASLLSTTNMFVKKSSGDGWKVMDSTVVSVKMDHDESVGILVSGDLDKIEKAMVECAMEGCCNPASVTWSNLWCPEDQWEICEPCLWLDEKASPPSRGGGGGGGGTIIWPHHDHHSHYNDNVENNGVRPPFLAGENATAPGLMDEDSKERSSCILMDSPKINVKTMAQPAGGSGTGAFSKSTRRTSTTSTNKFEKILSLRKLTQSKIKRCSADGCNLLACSLWSVWNSVTSAEKPFYACIDCQEAKFGGWPSRKVLRGKGFMSDEMIEIIARKCSNQKTPVMPPAFSN